MLLKHNKDICKSVTSKVYQDNVFQEIVKKLSPEVIYKANEELIRSFVDTLTNYAPVSINIVDYWNKDYDKVNIFVPTNDDGTLNTDWVFKFYDGVDESNFNLRNGFNEGPFDLDQHIVGDKQICKEHNGFYINSLIGLQDKLAYTFLNNIYTVAENAVNDPVLLRKLDELLIKIGLDPKTTSGFFSKINNLFNEDSYLISREFNSRKGQVRAFKYAIKNAQDANIQGDLTKQFYFKYEDVEPFHYKIESSLVPALFEAFIVPLVHPIGFTYDYYNVCKTKFEDIILRKDKILADRVYVYQLCISVDENDNILSPGDDNNPPQPLLEDGNTEIIKCPENPENIPNFDSEYTFATADGTGLWDGIQSDEGTGNVLVDIQEGIIYSGYFKNYNYKKYIFENKNYLISYSDPETGDQTIEYYRYNGTDWDLISRFINLRHVLIKTENLRVNSYTPIDETFSANCVEEEDIGIFGFYAGNTDPKTGSENYGFDFGIWDRNRYWNSGYRECPKWFGYLDDTSISGFNSGAFGTL